MQLYTTNFGLPIHVMLYIPFRGAYTWWRLLLVSSMSTIPQEVKNVSKYLMQFVFEKNYTAWATLSYGELFSINYSMS